MHTVFNTLGNKCQKCKNNKIKTFFLNEYLIDPSQDFSVTLPGYGYRGHTTSATHPCQCVPYFQVPKPTAWVAAFGILTCTHMGLHAGNTETESALKSDSGRKVPRHTGNQTHASTEPCSLVWHSAALYQLTRPCLSFPVATHNTDFNSPNKLEKIRNWIHLWHCL